MSLGVIALSDATTRKREGGRPITSAATCITMVDEPCPISAAPVNTVMEASVSSLRVTVAWGMFERLTGLAAPET